MELCLHQYPKGIDPALSLVSAGKDELHGPSKPPGVGKAGLGVDPGSEPVRSHRADSAQAGKVGRPHPERRLRRPVCPQGACPSRRGGMVGVSSLQIALWCSVWTVLG